jgi:hypothetical protein
VKIDGWLSLALPLLAAVLLCEAGAAPDNWMGIMGGFVFEQSFTGQSAKLMKAELNQEKMADEAQACSGFVNAYKASHDPRYKQRATQIADFLVANANLAGDGVPGWGPRLDEGYGFCPDRDNFTGKNLWETTRALDCLLQVSGIERGRANYVALSKRVLDHWPSVEKQLPDDGPYASKGMRFYYKNEELCARKYVKNTNIAMGETLYRMAKASGDERYMEFGNQVVNAELWEILTRRNFGYHGAMIYLEPNDPQNKQVYERYEKGRVVQDAAGNTVCRSQNPDPSCWNHLAFEAYALYQVQLLSGRDFSDPILRIMRIYRSSPFGDVRRFN